MKASDISDRDFLAAVEEAIKLRRESYARAGLGPDYVTATRWDVADVLVGLPEQVAMDWGTQEFVELPSKVVLAKAKRLIRRKLLDGCYCGCRGDFELTEKGRDLLASP